MKSQKKLILIITPHKKGGPWQWGADLAAQINDSGEFEAKHIFSVKDKLLSVFNFKAAIIHTTNPLAFSFLMRPIILTIHGQIFGWFWKFFYWCGVKRASIVTMPSEFLKNYLGVKNTIVLSNAVDAQKFTEVNLENREYFNILTVTKFWFPGKARGLFELAQIIFNLAKDFDKKINWRIVGHGPFLEDIKKSVGTLERPKNLSVQWFGFNIPQKYFSDSDIFAYFSYEDNMPIAIMEAMASGLPVVTNNIGAVSEIISNEKDGLISSSHQDYQNKLLKLMNNFDLREEIGRAASKKIKEKFSWEAVFPKWTDLYNKLIK